MHSQIEKIKNHVKRNKTTYITGGVCLVVGAAGAVLAVKKVDMMVNPKINQVLSWKPQATLEVHIEALGDPGNIIQDVTTGTIYASQNQTAKALGVNPATVSRHLNGELKDAGGHILKRLGKAHLVD